MNSKEALVSFTNIISWNLVIMIHYKLMKEIMCNNKKIFHLNSNKGISYSLMKLNKSLNSLYEKKMSLA